MSRGASLIAVGYGAYLLYAFWTGALYFYIHPIYIVPSIATGFVLLALAGVAGRTARAPSDHRASHGAPSWLGVGVLVLPLALGFLLPPQPLSVLSAAQRGVELGSLSGVEGPPEFTLGARPETYSIKDWVKALQADPEPGRHAGKPVRVVGFAYREDRLPRDWFLVARFVVKCCAVDAQPVGLPVRAAGGSLPEPGRWVSVEGAWEVAEVDGQRRAVVAATTVAPTERPDQPYLY